MADDEIVQRCAALEINIFLTPDYIIPDIGFSIYKLKEHYIPYEGVYDNLFLCNVAA